MTKQPRVALVCAGPISRSALSRLPTLREHLAWVKSTNLATATRAVNALRRGKAVRTYEELAGADIMMIRVPDEALDTTVAEMASSDLDWSRRFVCLIDDVQDTSALQKLEIRGAQVASIHLISDAPPRLIIEANNDVRRKLQRILQRPGMVVGGIGKGRKADYLAGVQRATVDVLALIDASARLFQHAGIEKATANSTVAFYVDATLKLYLRAGRRMVTLASRQSA